MAGRKLTAKGVKPSSQGKNKPVGMTTGSRKGPAKSSIGWEWQNFTQRAVAFNAAAKALAEHVKDMYGDSVSITQYERFCVAACSFTAEEKGRAFPVEEGVRLLDILVKAREARDDERRSFRSDASINGVEGPMAALLSSFRSTSVSIDRDGEAGESQAAKRQRTETKATEESD